MLKPVGGVSHVRVVHPFRALATDPTISTYLAERGEVPAVGVDMPKIYVLHRPILNGHQGLDVLRSLISKDWVVVTEFDDHPKYFEQMRKPDQYAFAGVHAVQTSTDALASILRSHNSEVAIFPNAIRELPDVQNFKDGSTITVFFGALNREQDWAPFVPTLNAVAQLAGHRLRFTVVHDLAFFQSLETAQKRFVPTCDYDTYLELLCQSEVCFMPLANTEFNRAKSDLKFIEAAASRVVSLASDIVYSASIEDSRTGILFRTEEELRERLLWILALPDPARRIGDQARNYVAQNRMLAYQTPDRIAWYRSLWARREELTHALVARVPELQSAVSARPATAARQ